MAKYFSSEDFKPGLVLRVVPGVFREWGAVPPRSAQPENYDDVEYFLILRKLESEITLVALHEIEEPDDLELPAHGRIGLERWCNTPFFIRPGLFWKTSDSTALISAFQNKKSQSTPISPDLLEESSLNYILKRL